MSEYLRPWKLLSFAVGMGYLFWGASYTNPGDWDYGVSIVMGVSAYLLAPWSYRWLVIERKSWWKMALGVFFGWLVVDGLYVAWHTYAGNPMWRVGNAYASVPMYLACMVLWGRSESLAEILAGIRKGFRA